MSLTRHEAIGNDPDMEFGSMKRNLPKARARTAIYHMLFGKQEHTYMNKGDRPIKRANLPENDPTRRLSCSYVG